MILLEAGADETSSTYVSKPRDSSADWPGVHYAYAAICILGNSILTIQYPNQDFNLAHDPRQSTQPSPCPSALLWGCHTGLRRARLKRSFCSRILSGCLSWVTEARVRVKKKNPRKQTAKDYSALWAMQPKAKKMDLSYIRKSIKRSIKVVTLQHFHHHTEAFITSVICLQWP